METRTCTGCDCHCTRSAINGPDDPGVSLGWYVKCNCILVAASNSRLEQAIRNFGRPIPGTFRVRPVYALLFSFVRFLFSNHIFLIWSSSGAFKLERKSQQRLEKKWRHVTEIWILIFHSLHWVILTSNPCVQQFGTILCGQDGGF
jgi:hypothetical protein